MQKMFSVLLPCPIICLVNGGAAFFFELQMWPDFLSPPLPNRSSVLEGSSAPRGGTGLSQQSLAQATVSSCFQRT